MGQGRSDETTERIIMKQQRGRIRKFAARGRSPLLGAALLLVLCGCGRSQDKPRPPQSPPRPVTSASAGYFPFTSPFANSGGLLSAAPDQM
jgi:hypothetical protein